MLFPALFKIGLLLLTIYVVRQLFRQIGGSAGRFPGGGPRSRFSAGAFSAGRAWRDTGQGRPPQPASRNIAVELVRCDRCGSFVSQACDRTDCIRR